MVILCAVWLTQFSVELYSVVCSVCSMAYFIRCGFVQCGVEGLLSECAPRDEQRDHRIAFPPEPTYPMLPMMKRRRSQPRDDEDKIGGKRAIRLCSKVKTIGFMGEQKRIYGQAILHVIYFKSSIYFISGYPNS